MFMNSFLWSRNSSRTLASRDLDLFRMLVPSLRKPAANSQFACHVCLYSLANSRRITFSKQNAPTHSQPPLWPPEYIRGAFLPHASNNSTFPNASPSAEIAKARNSCFYCVFPTRAWVFVIAIVLALQPSLLYLQFHSLREKGTPFIVGD